MKLKFKFCPHCGRLLTFDKSHGMKLKYCSTCRKHFFNNPAPGVAVIVVKDKQVLLVKRKLAPMKGTWALPGGFMDQGESILQAGLRELREETGLKAKKACFFDIATHESNVFGSVLVIAIKVAGATGTLQAGDDAEAAKYFEFNKLPFIGFIGHRNFIKKMIKQEL
ncbi:MAG: NUDIX hydrolase [bacterium]